ncbi:MAG TPA: hypothetical protein VMN82_02110 [Thermoanaerobaculia bacterium]|nr:hypothetical protein [Thermoanaerobaculia bacterium]
MKKVLLSAAIASALSVAALAQDAPNPRGDAQRMQSQAAATIHGSVTSVDNASRSFVVKDDGTGKESTVYWDGTTKMNGDLKVGSMVYVQITDASGKSMATTIDIKSAKKPY